MYMTYIGGASPESSPDSDSESTPKKHTATGLWSILSDAVFEPDKGFLRYFVWRSKKDDAITKALEESAKIVKDYQDANEAIDEYSTRKKLEEATKKWGSRHDSSHGKSTKSSKVRFSAGNRNKRHTYKRRSKT